MAEVPEGIVVLSLEVIWQAPFLPYSRAHFAFMEHAHACVTCERVVHDPAAVPENELIDDHLCEQGRELSAAVHDAIKAQRQMSLRN